MGRHCWSVTNTFKKKKSTVAYDGDVFIGRRVVELGMR